MCPPWWSRASGTDRIQNAIMECCMRIIYKIAPFCAPWVAPDMIGQPINQPAKMRMRGPSTPDSNHFRSTLDRHHQGLCKERQRWFQGLALQRPMIQGRMHGCATTTERRAVGEGRGVSAGGLQGWRAWSRRPKLRGSSPLVEAHRSAVEGSARRIRAVEDRVQSIRPLVEERQRDRP